MRYAVTLLASSLIFSITPLTADHHRKEKAMQPGSTLMGCLEKTGTDGYVLSDGTGGGVIVFGKDKLKNHVGNWVKIDGESFVAGGIEHVRARTVTHMSETCDVGFEETLGRKASAELKNGKGDVVGRAQLRQVPHGVLLKIQFENMPPGRHAMHIHEKRSCEPPDFKSAGGHFNPREVTHGYLAGKSHHAGDMPNFDVPESGEITLEMLNSMVSLSDSQRNSLFREEGTALVVHQGVDDYKSQPSGDAGNRIACGVIVRAN